MVFEGIIFTDEHLLAISVANALKLDKMVGGICTIMMI